MTIAIREKIVISIAIWIFAKAITIRGAKLKRIYKPMYKTRSKDVIAMLLER